jgi:hypothetical protein
MSFDDGSGDWCQIARNLTGLDLWHYRNGTDEEILTMTVGTWYFVALTENSGSYAIYALEEGETSFSTVITGTGGTGTYTAFRIGGSLWNEDWDNELAYGRVWEAELSQAELLDEALSATPVRTSNIYSAPDMDSTSDAGQDTSAANNDWTEVGEPYTVVDGPDFGPAPGAGMPWIHARTRIMRGDAYLRM